MRIIASHRSATGALSLALLTLLALTQACSDDASSSGGGGASGQNVFPLAPQSGGALAPAAGTAGPASTPSAAGTTSAATAGVGAAAGSPSSPTDPAAGANPSACPAAAPAAGTACAAMGFLQCDYDSGVCQCFNGNWMCAGGGAGAAAGTGGTAGANADGCPNRRPDDGAGCDVEGAMCGYRRGGDCECAGGVWSCESTQNGFTPDGGFSGFDMDAGPGNGGDPVDGGSSGDDACPTDAPEDSSACTAQGATCDYGATSCGCFGGAWRC